MSDVIGTDRVYFRQLLAGRDFATGDFLAQQMVNFVYLIGYRETREAFLVDPAYGVRELVDLAAADGFRITGVLATHYHADHCGGSIIGHHIEGLRDLLELDGFSSKIHVQRDEAEWVNRTTGVSETDLAQGGHNPTWTGAAWSNAFDAVSGNFIPATTTTPSRMCGR